MTKSMVMDKNTIKPKLFNVKNDPFERHDMTDLHPEKAEELLLEFNEMDCNHLSQGLYQLVLLNEGKYYLGKLYIQK